MATLYPGLGQPLYKASSNAQEPVWPNTLTIPDGSYSMGVALNAGMATDLNITYTSAPATATEIYYDTEPTFTNAIVLDTVPAGTDLINVWSTLQRLSGFLRVKNTSGVDITGVYIQQTPATVG